MVATGFRLNLLTNIVVFSLIQILLKMEKHERKIYFNFNSYLFLNAFL